MEYNYIGLLFRGYGYKIRLRTYSEFLRTKDENGKKITIISNQEQTYDKSWLEIKASIYSNDFKDIIENAHIKGKLTLNFG